MRDGDGAAHAVQPLRTEQDWRYADDQIAFNGTAWAERYFEGPGAAVLSKGSSGSNAGWGKVDALLVNYESSSRGETTRTHFEPTTAFCGHANQGGTIGVGDRLQVYGWCLGDDEDEDYTTRTAPKSEPKWLRAGSTAATHPLTPAAS